MKAGKYLEAFPMIKKSKKLEHVCYDIRGPVLDEAMRMERQGYNIIKLNIGNPAPFGFKCSNFIIRISPLIYF